MIPRRRFHRTVFIVAALYNIWWGLYAAVNPQWLFHLAGMLPLNHAEMLVFILMVVGL